MLWSFNMYQQFSGEMHASLETCYQFMQLAENLKDDMLMMEACSALGSLLLLLGRCSEALTCLEKGAVLYPTNRNHRNSLFISFDNGVMIDCFAALALLPLGYPDQSAKRLATGLALARDRGHPQTLVLAGHIAAQLHLLRGEAPLVRLFAKEAMKLADEHGFVLWVTYGLIELGWAEAELGRLEEGFAVITKALTLAERTGEGYEVSELHRIKGELFVKSADLMTAGKLPGDQPAVSALSQARACFSEAMAIAKQQGTRLLELRAAMSMDRLELSHGGSTRTQLAEIYSSFTEGHETADLKQARARLFAASVS